MRCRFGQNAVTWDEAKQFCGSQGGKLVEIETTEENSAIGAEILRQRISSKQLLFWTGLVGLDRRRPKNWVFDSTKEKPAWTEFHPGQGETEEENCAFLWAFSAPEVPFGSWHDINCGSKGFFFANRIHLSITALCGEYWYLDFLAMRVLRNNFRSNNDCFHYGCFQKGKVVHLQFPQHVGSQATLQMAKRSKTKQLSSVRW